jgi:anaerobic selenocysteine-containing dehydrogenase
MRRVRTRDTAPEVAGADLGFASIEALRREMGGLLGPRDLAPAAGSTRREPAPEGDALVLFTYPLLVDQGRLSVDADELKMALEEPAFVEVHHEDADRLGLADGARARLRTEAGEAELPVRVTPGVAPGTAFVPWNQPGLRANTLLSGRLHAAATLESASEEVPA